MLFETNKEVLDWYERQPRALTTEFIASIPWHKVKDHPLDKRLVPILLYMRDVEVLTEMYHDDLRRTPTGKDPVISKFMEKWGIEEIAHGEVLNRFLNEAGIATDNWYDELKNGITRAYKLNVRLITSLTNLVGRKFTATHMTFGAINELSTAQGYRRLIKLANHPVLEYIVKAIIREESVHTTFYWSVARLELRKSEFTQKLARFVIDNFWVPVGQGAKSVTDANYLIGTLFGGKEGLEWVDKNITQRISQLPGFDGLTKLNEKTREIDLLVNSPAQA
jgi:Fatty acid desaturase